MKKTLNTFKKNMIAAGLGLSLTAAAGTILASSEKPGDGVEITPIFPAISAEHFRGEVVNIGLRELGYEVEDFKETEYPPMMVALSYGDADFTVHLWDKLHDTFYQKVGGDANLTKVGTIISNVSQGYLIDKKTADKYNITSLADLKKPEIAKLFDSNGNGKADLTGCNPGWGCELMIEHHLKAYGLSETVTHNQGSYFALMADTIARFEQGESILYYTWSPQWIGGVLVPNEDVVYLSVPHTDMPDGNNDVNTSVDGKNLGFAIDQIRSIMNKEFADENPAARTFVAAVNIPADAESAQNLKMERGEKSSKDINRHAADWVAANRATFDGWLDQARSAVK
jgi:glycine betaine/proline transport system substrate-binding protein